MSKQPISLVDKMLERNHDQPTTSSPLCPVCQVPVIRRGYVRHRCPSCLLEFPEPVPTKAELPPLKTCPRCAKLGATRELVRVNGMWQWCAGSEADGFTGCNYEELVLTSAQAERMATTHRKAVGGCYGEPVMRSRVKGGKSSKGRKRRDGAKTGGTVVPLADRPVNQWWLRREGKSRRKGNN
jgi:hypothetical protein